MNRARGVTVIEILIVAIVLAILGAVVAPQLTRGNPDTRVGIVKANLLDVRGQIRLYYIQHKNRYPSLTDFAAQMMQKTDVEGHPVAPSNNAGTATQPAGAGTAGPAPGSAASKTSKLRGPYLPFIPRNPYTGGNSIGKGPIGTSDWFYDERTGVFRTNHHAALINL